MVSVDLMVQALCVQEVPITGLAENVLIQAAPAASQWKHPDPHWRNDGAWGLGPGWPLSSWGQENKSRLSKFPDLRFSPLSPLAATVTPLSLGWSGHSDVRTQSARRWLAFME